MERKLLRLNRCIMAVKNLSRQVESKKAEVKWVYPHPDVVKLEKKWLAARYALSCAEKAIWNS